MTEIRYIGVNDTDIDLFESQYAVPNGVSYNSYVILDEKIAVMDTVDHRREADYFRNLEAALAGRKPDYLVITHVEPDHASALRGFLDRYPEVCLVGNAKTWPELQYYFDLTGVQQLTVKEGEELSLGERSLKFIMAPMVHWPEVMMAYEASEGILFSADAFGTFGVLTGEQPTPETWDDEARRYYYNIVGKYGKQVAAVLKKAAALELKKVCPLHGPELTELLPHVLEKYALWADWKPERSGVLVAWTSIHGNTGEAARYAAQQLRAQGVAVTEIDLGRVDLSYAVAEALRNDRMLLASSTMDGEVMPVMAHYLDRLRRKGYRGRRVALMENGSWAPQAARVMRTALEAMPDLAIDESAVTIRGAVMDADRLAIDELVHRLL